MRLVSLVKQLLGFLKTDVLKAAWNAILVYYQLLRFGYIKESSQGENFVLISELNVLGDFNHFIVYQKEDKPSYAELLQLLDADEQLLSGFQQISKNLQQKLRGIHNLPLAISLLVNIIAIAFTYPYLKDDYLYLIHWNTEQFSVETLGSIAHAAVLPYLSWKRYLVPSYLFKAYKYLSMPIKWFINLFR